MNTDLRTLRRDVEALEDPALREETLRDLAGLENADIAIEQKLAEINRAHWDHWERHYAYKPKTKFRLVLMALFSGLVVTMMIIQLTEILTTGSYTLSRSQHIITVDANPITYWLYAVGFALGATLFMFATLFFVFAFLRHPNAPFKWMSRKRAF